MEGLAVRTEVVEDAAPTLFRSALGRDWDRLWPEAQALHEVQDMESFSGMAQVSRGKSAIARLAAWIFGFPPEGDGVPVRVTKTRTDAGETWERDFGGRVFRSYCSPSAVPRRFRERFGLLTYEMELPVENGEMTLPVVRGWVLGIPLPRVLLPTSDSREFVRDGVFNFDVALGAPLSGGLIVRYRGWLRPDRAKSARIAE